MSLVNRKEYERRVIEILDTELDRYRLMSDPMYVEKRCKEIVVDRCAERDFIPVFSPEVMDGLDERWLVFRAVKLAPPC